MTDTIEIEIDGKPIPAKSGEMLIAATDRAGIYIPRFCYHKKLSIAANCRMCLIDVDKVGKPLPACATPVAPGMKVSTKSVKALEAQKAVMEFLLINHPLDCPVCDQGGQCELQDIAMGYGKSHSRFEEGKRAVSNDNLGSLIATEMTRCILCTRCVRFGEEVAGQRELGDCGRGEHSQITTYVKQGMQYEMSGNIIDLCPVGALLSKPFLYTARAWELEQYSTIAAHDCIGSNIYAHSRRGQVMRVVPKENEAINETWIADRDRFGYEGLNSQQRLDKPLIKVKDHWQQVDWQTALNFVAEKLSHIKEKSGADNIAALASPNSTVEEFYLLQKLLRQFGSDNIDHRIRQIDFLQQEAAPLSPGLNMELDTIEQADAILLIGANVKKEQPIANHRIRKASLQGAAIMAVNPIAYECNYPLSTQAIVTPTAMVSTLAGIAKACINDNTASASLSNITPTAEQQAIAKQLLNAKRPVLLLGAIALQGEQATLLQTLANIIASATKGRVGCLTDGANSAGAWLAGCVPHRKTGGAHAEQAGHHAQAMLAKQLAAYILLNIEPDVDCANAALATQAIQQAQFVVALTPYNHALFTQHADVILPIAPATETSGTFVNAMGHWQTFKGVVKPYQETRPAWKVLRVLGNLLYLDGFKYTSSEDVLTECRAMIAEANKKAAWEMPETLPAENAALQLIMEWPIYAVDSTLRRAQSLQQSGHGYQAAVYVNQHTADQYSLSGETVKVTQGNNTLHLPLVIDARVANNTVLIPAGLTETSGLNRTEKISLV